ncbi:ABC transporter permease [Nostocoides sp. HKS02]|uniref:ABC transporter permease n=1 Tax=Nostocoides sp. HKS02 TaxID=1813880 RepID=UPI0012B49379|nr:ABC transporter permease [Tetrasphaera sp. HKS02]QGN57983.1 ABC transporter permease subunit [Tetrasphaera sp. HKS02]
MYKYVIRRLLQMIPVLLGATFIIFAMVFALPGDPTAGMCGERPCSPGFVAQFRAEHNLNDPLPTRYAKYMANLAQGDLGTTFRGEQVSDELAQRYPTTAKLALMAIVFEALIGVLAGVFAGIRKGKFIDNLVLVSTLFVIAIPVFVIGETMQYYLGVKWSLFPVTVSPDATFYELLMPAFVLGSSSIAYAARLTRTNLVENLRADYIRTAIAKGLTRRRAIGLHALRNSLIPVITFVGADFGSLLGGAIVTERIFNIQGVGGYLYTGIHNRDGVSVVGTVTILVLVFLLVNLLVDLLYGVLDPRISHD